MICGSLWTTESPPHLHLRYVQRFTKPLKWNGECTQNRVIYWYYLPHMHSNSAIVSVSKRKKDVHSANAIVVAKEHGAYSMMCIHVLPENDIITSCILPVYGLNAFLPHHLYVKSLNPHLPILVKQSNWWPWWLNTSYYCFNWKLSNTSIYRKTIVSLRVH